VETCQTWTIAGYLKLGGAHTVVAAAAAAAAGETLAAGCLKSGDVHIAVAETQIAGLIKSGDAHMVAVAAVVAETPS
jgi:hypothetical protein